MKKSYKFGEILLYVREEYKEYKHLLNDLSQCIRVLENKSYYFESSNFGEKDKIRLRIEKKYSEVSKKIKSLRYDWYSMFFYTAFFNVIKSGDSTYKLEDDSTITPIDGSKRFKPSVDIIDQERFDNIIEELLSLDIMKIQQGSLHIDYDLISLDFGNVFISSKLGYKSLLEWDGRTDTIDYLIKKDGCPYLIERILYLEIPTEYISREWLQIFEKHEHKFNAEMFFEVDIDVPRKQGFLQIDTTNSKNIRLVRKKIFEANKRTK